MALDVHYLVDEKGRRVGVLLSPEQYEEVLRELEELAAIRAYDAAKAASDEVLPFEQAVREIEEKKPES